MSTAVFSFIYSEEKFFVRDEQELALIFELLKDSQDADILHWNIIMSLDEQLLQMIVSYTGLLACLQFLSNKNRFLFFVKLGDILSRILSKSEYF
jgi:hypothetical protein